MHPVAVRNIEQSFFKEPCRTMRNHAVTLHLTETKPAISATAFSWLPGQNLGGSTTPRMHLVLNHVLQSLVIRRSQEYHDLHLFATKAIVHDLISAELVSKIMQLLRDQFYCTSLFRRRTLLEGGCVAFLTF